MEKSTKTAFIIGTSGIGKKLFLPLSELGFTDVVVTYHLDNSAADEWTHSAIPLGIRATAIQLDATDPASVKKIVADTVNAIGRIDAVIVLLGSFLSKPPTTYSPEEWQSLFATNVHAPYYIAQQTLPHLEKTHGSLLFFGVAHADQLHSQPMTMPYAAAKTALLVMMRTLARVEAQFGVRINMISPGLIDNGKQAITDFDKIVPSGKAGTAEDINAAVRYLLSEQAVYVTGTNLIVSGGWAI
ncbi:MAG: SDR family oxidoreductase [bacterium]|nr:SDR family oxidoreductase [bacterium]